ncbi:hypothetical protein MMC25_000342 [Agyrium rufum]|nr:hypothetical protein [Agyrium rufum]
MEDRQKRIPLTRGQKLGIIAKLIYSRGGYSTALTEDHFELSYSLLQDQRPSSIAILQATYPLSPPSMYPAQLRSATTLLKHLLDPDTSPLRSPRPSRILLAGDSAGGHLVLSLLGHIAFPHPDTSIPRLTVEGADRSFMGTVLVSPWASCEEEGKESMSVNRDDDILAVDLQKRWGLGYQGHAPSDEYTWPLFEGRREGWWEKVGELVDGILMISGADEILGSGIAELTKQIKVSHHTSQAKYSRTVALAQSPCRGYGRDSGLVLEGTLLTGKLLVGGNSTKIHGLYRRSWLPQRIGLGAKVWLGSAGTGDSLEALDRCENAGLGPFLIRSLTGYSSFVLRFEQGWVQFSSSRQETMQSPFCRTWQTS